MANTDENGAAEANTAAADNASPDKPAGSRKPRRLDVNPELILSTSGRSKRRRTPTPPPEKPEADPRDPERAKTLGLQIYNKVMNMTDSDGEPMAEPFITLPSKKEFPDYYETIKHPISLEMVHDKLQAGTYQTLGQVCADLGTIWNNAKRYNMSESLLFQWAKHMHKITRNFLISHTHGHNGSDSEDEELPPPPPPQPPAPPQQRRAPQPVPTPPAPRLPPAPAVVPASHNAAAGPSTPQGQPAKIGGPGTGRKRGSYMKDGPTVYKLIKPCMRSIKDAKADDGREIAAAFMVLPDRRIFPDYYRMIKNPMTLTDIESRMVARRFDSAEQFFEEIERMCDNAQQYNEDGSPVWRDARQIRGVVASHRELVKERLSQPRGTPSKTVRVPTSTPLRHHMPPATPTPIPGATTAPPLATHAVSGMMLPPDVRAAYVAQTGYGGFHTPPAHPQQLPMTSPQPQQLPQVHASPAPFLPQLPQGIVTEEIVATLDRYPPYEQQAWIASLPPLAQTTYRQILAVNEARKRGVAPPAPPEPVRVPEPAAPLNPTIKHIDFSCNANTLRLENMRGILTHAVAFAAPGDEIELQITAWIDGAAAGEDVVMASPSRKLPELALKVNGTPTAGAPTPIYGEDKDQPAAVRWSFPVKGSDAKVELVATKPGSLSETSAIFVNRQY